MVIQIILWMVVVNGVVKCIVGQGGILLMLVVLNLICKFGMDGGLIFSVSYNFGGEDEDFGLKYNGLNGGLVSEGVIDKIFVCIKEIDVFYIVVVVDIDLIIIGDMIFGDMVVLIIDFVVDYVELME